MAFALMFSTHPILSSDRSAGRIAEGVVIGITIARTNFQLASPSSIIKKISCKVSMARLFPHQPILKIIPILVP